jgi:phosphoserine phosphatase
VFRYIAPVLRYAVKHKLGRATLEQMEHGVGKVAEGYLAQLSRSKRIAGIDRMVEEFWDGHYSRIKPWYHPEPDDVIITASFDLNVGEACRRLGVSHLISSEVDMETMKVTYLNFNTNKSRRFREVFGPDAVIDEFYTDSMFDQPMIDMARHAFMVKGNSITQIK